MAETVTNEVRNALEVFICPVYHLNINIMTLAELFSLMFSKKQTNEEKLPPTRGAFISAIKRANYHAIEWLWNDL